VTAVVVESAPELAAAWASLPAALIERVRPSIVRVGGRGRSGASGVVWPPGAVVTNHHVVAGATAEVPVMLADGRVLAARVVRASRRLDLALLALEAGVLTPAPIGDSTRLRVGELVFAVGHPWGQPWVVTTGIVSGLGPVQLPGRRGTARLIRSDVRLAPGNSGGPLLDARGRVVGLNAMILGGDLAVAIPSDVARSWLEASA
jgi:serine protease Do